MVYSDYMKLVIYCFSLSAIFFLIDSSICLFVFFPFGGWGFLWGVGVSLGGEGFFGGWGFLWGVRVSLGGGGFFGGWGFLCCFLTCYYRAKATEWAPPPLQIEFQEHSFPCLCTILFIDMISFSMYLHVTYQFLLFALCTYSFHPSLLPLTVGLLPLSDGNAYACHWVWVGPKY